MGEENRYWDSSREMWVHVGNDLDKDIKSALDISNRQAPPNFISLPLKPIAGGE
jgi:hypothetical protein